MSSTEFPWVLRVQMCSDEFPRVVWVQWSSDEIPWVLLSSLDFPWAQFWPPSAPFILNLFEYLLKFVFNTFQYMSVCVSYFPTWNLGTKMIISQKHLKYCDSFLKNWMLLDFIHRLIITHDWSINLLSQLYHECNLERF